MLKATLPKASPHFWRNALRLERLLTMTFANPSDAEIAARSWKPPASSRFVGASPKPDRPVYGVMERLLAKGYTVIPVNPGQAGSEILSQKVYASLADVPAPADVVDVFRASDAALAVVDEAIAQRDRLGLKAVWMQIGVVNEVAAQRAGTRG